MASDLSLLFTLKAKNEASNEIKSLERQMALLKDSIKAVKAEDTPFKTQRLEALRERLKEATARHRELTKEAKESANAIEKDLGGALQVVAPRLAALAGSAGPIALVAAGFAATAIVAQQLGVAIFDLTKKSADFEGKLFDLSQQAGVSVETLSAFEILAAQTGGSIDSVVASLGIFQKNLEDSLDTTSKSAAAFRKLGVEVTTTEETLRATLKSLSRMPEGFQQTAAALEIFGRGGKQLLAILKETNGDLDEAIDRLKDFGVVVSGDAAKRADEFNDQLALLQFQMRGLGTQAIPVVLEAVKSLSKFLKENKDAVHALGLTVKGLAFLFVGPLQGAIFGFNKILEVNTRLVQLGFSA